MSEQADSATIVAFVSNEAPVVYWGELLNGEDPNAIYIGKPLVMVMKPKSDDIGWTKPVACGTDSVLIINQTTTKGILVVNPDAESVGQYKQELLQAYTKLTLLRP